MKKIPLTTKRNSKHSHLKLYDLKGAKKHFGDFARLNII